MSAWVRSKSPTIKRPAFTFALNYDGFGNKLWALKDKDPNPQQAFLVEGPWPIHSFQVMFFVVSQHRFRFPASLTLALAWISILLSNPGLRLTRGETDGSGLTVTTSRPVAPAGSKEKEETTAGTMVPIDFKVWYIFPREKQTFLISTIKTL